MTAVIPAEYTLSLEKLRRFVRQPSAAIREERCELCSLLIAPEHPHLLDMHTRRLMCACPACALLFDQADRTSYRRVPQTVRQLTDFRISQAQWESLLIPINLAYFFFSTPDEKMSAQYPSPAGALESLLSLETWEEIRQDNPLLASLKPDVEALLVNRLDPEHERYFCVPIDQCYRLVGLLRTHWRGLSGGVRVWKEIGTYFEQLERLSQTHA